MDITKAYSLFQVGIRQGKRKLEYTATPLGYKAEYSIGDKSTGVEISMDRYWKILEKYHSTICELDGSRYIKPSVCLKTERKNNGSKINTSYT